MVRVIDNYYVNEQGEVYSGKSNKILAQRQNNKGYLIVNLSINGKCTTFEVHRLVAAAYIPNPENLPTINHKNGIKTDNRVENLEWMSYRDNILHAHSNGLVHPAIGLNTKFGKFTQKQILEIRALKERGLSQYKIAALFNVSRSTIQQILEKRCYKYIE